MRRALIVFAAVLGLSAVVVRAPAPTASAQTAPTAIGSVIVEGTGFGHGRGLSQYGAYGWAVDYGRPYSWILDHYYGGTERGAPTSTTQRIEAWRRVDGEWHAQLLGKDAVLHLAVSDTPIPLDEIYGNVLD